MILWAAASRDLVGGNAVMRGLTADTQIELDSERRKGRLCAQVQRHPQRRPGPNRVSVAAPCKES